MHYFCISQLPISVATTRQQAPRRCACHVTLSAPFPPRFTLSLAFLLARAAAIVTQIYTRPETARMSACPTTWNNWSRFSRLLLLAHLAPLQGKKKTQAVQIPNTAKKRKNLVQRIIQTNYQASKTIKKVKQWKEHSKKKNDYKVLVFALQVCKHKQRNRNENPR